MKSPGRLLAFVGVFLASPALAQTPVPRQTLPPNELCTTEWRQGNFQICEAAVAATPNDVTLLRYLAKAYIEVADFSEAINVFERIADLSPNDPKSHEDLAGTLGFVRAYEPAVRAMRRVLHLRPAKPEDYRALAIMYVNLNDPGAAAAMTEKAALMGDPVAMFDLRRHYIEGFGIEKNLTKAVEWTQKAAEAGHLGAMALMSDIYLEGLYGQRADEARAIEWAERLRAAEKPL